MEIMIDVETLATSRNARVLQIGAVGFTFDKVLEPHELLQRDLLVFDVALDSDWGIDPRTTTYLDGTVTDPETVAWWSHPDQAEAREAITLSRRRALPGDAFELLAAWIKRNLGKKARVWAKPPQFDLEILRHGFEVLGMACPWDHRQEACLRTLQWAAKHVLPQDFKVPSTKDAGLIKHFALHDAAAQVVVAQAAHRALTSFQRRNTPAGTNTGIIVGKGD